jgi:hypothetical protein
LQQYPALAGIGWNSPEEASTERYASAPGGRYAFDGSRPSRPEGPAQR